MSELDLEQVSVKDRLLARPRRIWQATPDHLRPVLAVAYYSLIAVILRGMARLISAAFGEAREFRINSATLGVIVVSALISALAFGLARAKLPSGPMKPWILGQVVAWSLWYCFLTISSFGLAPPRTDTRFEIMLTPVLLGLLPGFVFWVLKGKRYAA